MKLDVKGSINIKRKIIVNGREYSSVEDLPVDIRRAYEQAMAASGREAGAATPAFRRARIVFNGKEYGDVDEMPDDVRRLYEAAMTVVEADGANEARLARAAEPGTLPIGPEGSAGPRPPSMEPIEVGGGSSSRVLAYVIAIVVVLILLGALFYFGRPPQ